MKFLPKHFDANRSDHICKFNASVQEHVDTCPACGWTVVTSDERDLVAA